MANVPHGFGAMAPPGGGGGNLARGESRNPTTVALLSLVTCGFYGLYWMYFQVLPEIKSVLGKPDSEINPMRDFTLALVTCGIWHLLVTMKLGGWIREAQARSGRQGAEDKGVVFLVVAFLFAPAAPFLIQTELNRAWDPALP